MKIGVCMKKCFQCDKTYDDTWGVCLNCQNKLVDIDKETNHKDSKPHFISLGENFIQKHIDRTNRNLLLTNLIVIAGAIYLGVAILSEKESEGAWVWLLIIGLGALGVWNIIKVQKRKKQPLLHPIRISLAKIGPQKEVEGLINKEVQASKLSRDSIVLTDSWLIKTSMYGVDISLLGELAWIYRKVTQRSVNFVPVGKEYSVVICKRDGKEVEISCGEQDSTRIQEVIMKSAPWVIGGFSDELKALWSSKRSEFLVAVDQRRRESKETIMKGDN